MKFTFNLDDSKDENVDRMFIHLLWMKGYNQSTNLVGMFCSGDPCISDIWQFAVSDWEKKQGHRSL